MDSDEELYARVRKGELRAFDDLYARYEGPLFGFLLASLGNRADAEDVFHEAFLNTLKSRAVTFERGAFRTWLFRIARNVALNRRRSDARGTSAYARILPDPPPPSPHDELEARQVQAALDGAVARLPPSLAEVFRLRISGLRYDEIAEVLEAPLGTIKSRMHEVVRLLREDMGTWIARGYISSPTHSRRRPTKSATPSSGICSDARLCLGAFLALKRQTDGELRARPSDETRARLRADVARSFPEPAVRRKVAWLARPIPLYQGLAAVLLAVVAATAAPDLAGLARKASPPRAHEGERIDTSRPTAESMTIY